MSLQWKIVEQPFEVTLYGVSKQHRPGAGYGETVMELLDKVWAEVRGRQLPNRGQNHVIYGADDIVFAGVELDLPLPEAGDPVPNLTVKTLVLREYAYCVHRGPYDGLGRTYDALREAVQATGRECRKPLLEVYGHWQEDESLLETEIYFSLL